MIGIGACSARSACSIICLPLRHANAVRVQDAPRSDSHGGAHACRRVARLHFFSQVAPSFRIHLETECWPVPDVANDQYTEKLAVAEGYVPATGITPEAHSYLESQYAAAGPDRHKDFIARRDQISQAYGSSRGGPLSPPAWLAGWAVPAFDSAPQPLCGDRGKWSRHFDPAGFQATLPNPSIKSPQNACPARGDRVRPTDMTMTALALPEKCPRWGCMATTLVLNGCSL